LVTSRPGETIPRFPHHHNRTKTTQCPACPSPETVSAPEFTFHARHVVSDNDDFRSLIDEMRHGSDQMLVLHLSFKKFKGGISPC
jgi:hypothetical protein